MLIKYTEVAPGMVRIDSKIENLLTIDKYLEEANRLLEGKKKIQNQNLKDLSSRDLHDSLLLSTEKLEDENAVHTVVFSIEGKDVIVNKKNIAGFLKEKNTNKKEEQFQAIREAVEESFERG